MQIRIALWCTKTSLDSAVSHSLSSAHSLFYVYVALTAFMAQVLQFQRDSFVWIDETH